MGTPRTPTQVKATPAAPNKPVQRRSLRNQTPSSSDMVTPSPKIIQDSQQEIIRETPGYQQSHEENYAELLTMLGGINGQLTPHLKHTGRPTETQHKLSDIFDALNDMRHRIKQMKQDTRDTNPPYKDNIDQRLDKMETKLEAKLEAKLEEISNLVKSTAKTWAQVTATGTTMNGGGRIRNMEGDPTNKVSNENTERKQQLRKQQQECELVLTTNPNEKQTKEELENLHPKAIVEQLRNVINTSKTTGEKPKLLGIHKLNTGLRLFFNTAEEAKTAHNVNWSLAYSGLEVHRPKYGIVVHSVRREELDIEDQQTTIKQLEEANNLTIIEVKPLRGNWPKITPHHSIIIFTENIEAANECLKRDTIFINYQTHPVERYLPQMRITQCFKCYGYGHRAKEYRKQRKYGKCMSEEHETNMCEEQKQCCTQCKGEHPAWSFKCPSRKAESERLADIKRQGSPFFQQLINE
jgi:hypothetical protein